MKPEYAHLTPEARAQYEKRDDRLKRLHVAAKAGGHDMSMFSTEDAIGCKRCGMKLTGMEILASEEYALGRLHSPCGDYRAR